MKELVGIILLVVTSHSEMESGKPTGLWLEEFAVPYHLFTEAGYEVMVASPKGGEAPVDPRSLPDQPTQEEAEALALLKDTLPLSDLPATKKVSGIFFAGGHGTMFDFPNDPQVQKLVSSAMDEQTPLALVCHGPAALVGASTPEGTSVLQGRRVTGFTNAEERAVNLVDEVPFLLESKLQELGGTFIGGKKFQPHVIVDGNLITGQNPASSAGTAKALLKQAQTQ